MDAGVTIEQIQNILIAGAPIVGTPRTASGALNITKPLGIVIVALEDELEAEDERAVSLVWSGTQVGSPTCAVCRRPYRTPVRPGAITLG